MDYETYRKLKFRYKFYQIAGISIFGIGCVMLFGTFLGLLSDGVTSIPGIIIGIIIAFLGSLLKNVGKEREKQLME